ncbi:hypothetical protein [Kutzneria kofuensis]|uniref:Uncharacterized protein n=1 Tax=Kutzneria kofuensis TaxID=103725 RepID=A0A7W9NKS8_9PSEU|nr:hypothetical protein [Kutzneria kofuensis]MBB5896962.1 hypothetical protein [Kutzneria kofuensis]
MPERKLAAAALTCAALLTGFVDGAPRATVPAGESGHPCRGSSVTVDFGTTGGSPWRVNSVTLDRFGTGTPCKFGF